jgi:hypothetical protein
MHEVTETILTFQVLYYNEHSHNKSDLESTRFFTKTFGLEQFGGVLNKVR